MSVSPPDPDGVTPDQAPDQAPDRTPEQPADRLAEPVPDPIHVESAASPAMIRYVELFNAGEFWESHEVLEAPWRETRSPFLHGLILLASAWVHADRGNLHGVRAQLGKTIRALEAWEAGGEGGIESGRPTPGLDPRELILRCQRWLHEADRLDDPGTLARWPRPQLVLRPGGTLP